VGCRFDDWIYWPSLLQLHLNITLHTLNPFLITNLSMYFYWFSDWSVVYYCSVRLSSAPVWLSPVESSRVESSLTLRPTVRRPVCLGIKHSSGAYDQTFITVRQLRVCWCGAFSLTRRRVCRLHLLLALASAVILGSVFRGTRDHILLYQIRDFPFCRLLSCLADASPFIASAEPYRKDP
jgi:hypothetical protein